RAVGVRWRPKAGGASRVVRIGAYPARTVAKARDAARRYLGEVADGGSPAAERRAERMRDKATLRVLLAEGGAYPRALENRGVVNIKPALSSLRRGLHGLMSKEVSTLTRRDLVDAIEAVEHDRGPGAADDLRKFSRVFLEWGIKRGFLAVNPLPGFRRAAGTRPG